MGWLPACNPTGWVTCKVDTRVQRPLTHPLGFVGSMLTHNTFPESLHGSWVSVLTDPARLSILRGLCELGTTTTAELAARCHTSDRTVRRHLEALEALGLVHTQAGERDGLTPGRPASRYTIDGVAAARLHRLFEVLSEPLVPTPVPG